MTFNPPRSWFFVLFTISGFAGLIYESIWTHYLKLFLGHAAYAQTLVLAMFMGGMALGAWLCSRYSGHWRNLLIGYAVAEAAIGVFALTFHPVFVSLTDYAYGSVMPAIGTPLGVNAFKWLLSALFILPQSVLLGMTFPLMTAGVMRAYPDNGGGSIAMLYFTNSLGAAAGVLASGFVLIGLVGLPGTMLTAGLINLALAAAVWLLAKGMTFQPVPRPSAAGSSPARIEGYALMLLVSLLTGAASFMYEIGWIRMLSMVLGSSTHAFELMLSAFILGLAFGGLWVRRRIDRTGEPERLLGIVQVVMGLFALGTLLVYGQTFHLMQALLETVARTEEGYAAFNLGSHLIALVVMFPAAFCAGMTLPLITQVLLRRGTGERAIGAVYAANTVGAVTGVVLAVHIGMPLLGLKGLIALGAAIDMALGVALLWSVRRSAWLPRFALASCLIALGASLIWVELDSYKMASGVYRHGRLLERDDAKMVFHRDGKTTTVNLLLFPGRLSITTNGKSDAAINPNPQGPLTIDEITMVLTGALPMALHPEARTAANIGIGSGLSSHIMLGSKHLQALDTIEIEAAMVEAARGFGERNAAVYRDPRSRIHIEDAKTFFSLYNKRYDIIVSEPSNPWVSGVSSLFGEEFYRRVRGHLNENGLFVQWLQLYEINPALVASVFKALGRHFSDYDVYTSSDSDLIIVARNGGALPPPSESVFSQPAIAAALKRVQIANAADLALHRLGNKAALQPYFESFPVPANSDYFPFLDLRAARARFMQDSSRDIANLGALPIPALEMLGGASGRTDVTLTARAWLQRAEQKRVAYEASAYLLDGRVERLPIFPAAWRSDLELARLRLIECAGPAASVDHLASIARALIPFLPGEALEPVWQKVRSAPCAQRLGDVERAWLALYMAVGKRDAAEMARLAEALLAVPHPANMARRDYLLGAAIVGRLALGERERAALLWKRYAPQLVSDRSNMLPDLLRGHLLAAGAAL